MAFFIHVYKIIGYNIFCTYMQEYICTENACSSFGCIHKGEYPLKPQIKIEYLRVSAVLLYFCIVPRTTGGRHTLHSCCMSHPSGHECALLMLCLCKAMLFFPFAGSVVLTQTHPAAPYVCRTGNITLGCQYDGVEGVSSVVWIIGFQATTNPSTIPGHIAIHHTTTYQEVVVASYTNLATGYRCEPTFSNGSQIQSRTYVPQKECECYQTHNLVDM